MTMKTTLNKVQLRALFQSIQHWKRIVRRKEPSSGTTDCALCQAFFEADCEGCPVREAAGKLHCMNTPYVRFREVVAPAQDGVTRWVRTSKAEKAAEKELKFLKGIWKERAGMKRREYAAKTK